MTSAPPIGFRYQGSRLLMLALAAIMALAWFSVFEADLPRAWQAVLVLAIAIVGGTSLARVQLPRVRSLLWRTDGGVRIETRDSALDKGREVEATLHAAHVLGPLITLQLRWPGHGRGSLWLLPDNLDADTRRRLRIRIGHGGQDD